MVNGSSLPTENVLFVHNTKPLLHAIAAEEYCLCDMKTKTFAAHEAITTNGLWLLKLDLEQMHCPLSAILYICAHCELSSTRKFGPQYVCVSQLEMLHPISVKMIMFND